MGWWHRRTVVTSATSPAVFWVQVQRNQPIRPLCFRMADTTDVRKLVPDWVRSHFLPKTLGEDFESREVRLRTDGRRVFPAVSADSSIVVTISTSGDKTGSGNGGEGKKHKVRSDMLFLLMADASRRIQVFTDRS